MAAAVDKTQRPVNFLCKSRSKRQKDQPEVYRPSRLAEKHLVQLNLTKTIESGQPGDPCHRLVKSKTHILFILDLSRGRCLQQQQTNRSPVRRSALRRNRRDRAPRFTREQRALIFPKV